MITSFVTKKSLFVFCHCLVSITPHPCSRILIFAHIFWILFDDFHTWVHSKGEHEGGVGWRYNAELQAKQREYRNGSRCSLTRPRMTKKTVLVRFLCIHITELYEIQRQQMSLCACCYYQEIKLFNSQMNFRLSLFVFLHPPHRALRNIDRTQLRLNTQLKINRENICLHILFATTQSLYYFLNK